MIFSGSDAQCRFGRGNCCGDRLPEGWQQDTQVVLVGHGGEPLQDVGEVGFGVVAVAADALNQGVNDGAALAGGFAADEEPVLLADGSGADAVLNPVVVDLELALIDVEGELVPEGEGVVDGFAQGAFGQNFGAGAQGDEVGFENLQQRGGVGLAELNALGGLCGGFAEGSFHLIDLCDGGERGRGEGLAGFEGFVEFAPGVGPAGDEGNAVFISNPGVVGGVSVGLQIALVVAEEVVEAGGFAAGVPLIEYISLGCWLLLGHARV